MKRRHLKLKGNTIQLLIRLLEDARISKRVRVGKKIEAILMNRKKRYSSGNVFVNQSSFQIAQKLNVSKSRVNEWLRAFEINGIESLNEKVSPGRPARMSKGQIVWLKKILKVSPKKYGINSEKWDWKLLDKILTEELGLKFHQGYLRKLLVRHRGYTQKRKRFEKYFSET